MSRKAVFDVSSFILFEATGDSEVDREVPAAAMDVAEDDALSCSACTNEYINQEEWGGDKVAPSNASKGCTVVHQQRKKLKIGDDYHSRGEEMEEDDSCSTTGVVDQECNGDEAALPTTRASFSVAVPKKSKKLKTCEAPNIKLLNQGDRDKLFWEACLGS
ncbi:Hypothetical predicted protein [Olea europaea subsp. europaea]|uniref:Uncharacterized protein n=1 Tax=Olea europaea subsp. europaea TaxID=158383 RepID=A0A8S0V9E3_OLEEU|nr:Hypothetical predicted protein [Olea europaea subsp. europaea]